MQIGPYTIVPKVILAPMAGVTDKPFRLLCKRLGAGLAVSEMTTSDPRFWNTAKSLHRMDHAGEPDPVSVQIAGTVPEIMAEAARHNVEHGAQLIDINLGCPAKKVCNAWAGSALMRDPPLVARILAAVVDTVDVPVTLKIRTGWNADNRNAPEIARIAQDAGIAALAVHGRTRDQQYTGVAEYDTIAEIKAMLEIPVIANGDIDSPEKAKQVLDATGCDAVMVGRAAQGRPWIFREIAHYLATGERLPEPSLDEVRDILLAHLEHLHAFYGETSGVRIARKHLGWYAKDRPENAAFRAVVNRAQTANEQIRLTRDYFDALAAGVAPGLSVAARTASRARNSIRASLRPMGRNVYRFGDYALDPASRELRCRGEHVALPPKSFDCLVYLIENRERAIGRDELISAVWGRVDASDAVVSQTLLRARRAIGDTGTEQSAVRTVTRFGYQWVAPVESVPQEVEAHAADAQDPGVQEPAVDDIDGPATPAAAEDFERRADVSDALIGGHDSDTIRQRKWPWRIAAITIVMIVAVALAVGLWRHVGKSPTAGVTDMAVVLPVAVESGGAEHAWIRLGAMDYIASLLRRGRLGVLPSERTLALVDAEHAIAPETIDHLHAVARARWVLQPVASAVPQGWRVRIRVSAPDESYDVEARGNTPLEAAAAATSTLLHRLGHDGPAAPAPTALTQRLQQVDAELLVGQMDATRDLIEGAPAAQRKDPQLQVREGQLEFRLGRLDAAQGLFDRIVDSTTTLPVEVRSQALMGLGAVALRRQDHAEAERRYDEAVHALEADAGAAPDPALLGNAYNGRGVARVELGRVDGAIADLGRARIAMQRSGDEVEAASVGGNIGTLKARNGDAAQAIQEFDLAIATFERFDVRDSLVVMLLAKSDAELQLLQPTAALDDSRRAMELGSKLENPQLRAFMAATRAEALLGNGRLQDAEGLLRQDHDASPALRLRLLLERGRVQDAHKFAQDLLHDAPGDDPETLLLATQAAIGGSDSALARQWLQSRAGKDDGENHDEVDLASALLAAATGDQATAVHGFDAAVKAAARTSAPADDARAGSAWAIYLVGRGELDRASGVMGSLTPYVDHDYRVARASLALYRALGDRDLQAQAETRVHRLAGERDPDSPVVY